MSELSTLRAVEVAHLKRVLLVPDLARALSVSEGTARKYLASGELPGARVGGKWVVSRDVFLAHLARESSRFECADCAGHIPRAVGVTTPSGLTVCRDCAERLNDVGRRS